MLFVTIQFFVFFAIVYLLFWILPRRFRFYVLLLASILYFASWSVVFVIHFLFIMALNYFLLERYRQTENDVWFYFTQAINIGNLCLFKYFYLFADFLGMVFGIQSWLAPTLKSFHNTIGWEIILPVGISFYTFQVMAYGFDLKRKVYTTKHSFLEFLLFISFFPQLIAGPIMRASNLLPRVRRLKLGHTANPSKERIYSGLWLILLGVFKKALISDILLSQMSSLYSYQGHHQSSGATMWIAAVAFLVMLYADFSAYSDLCRGMGHLLGFHIPINFRAPFFMKSFTDLWRRWHLTFSSWIRDYIFKPLGGSNKGEGRQYINLMITFLFAGLWHGAAYSFLLWGLFMGLFLVIEAFLAKRGFPQWPTSVIGKIFRLSIVWVLYLASGIFFFGQSLDWSLYTLQSMFTPSQLYTSGESVWPDLDVFFVVVVSAIVCQLYEEKPEWFRFLNRFQEILLPILFVILIFVISTVDTTPKEFYYFQF